MKKLTALISALALLLSFCACSDQAEGTPSESVSPSPAASQGPVLTSETPSAAPTEKTEPSQPGVEPSAVPTEKTETPEPSVEPSAAPTETGTGLSTAEMIAIANELKERHAPVSELYAAIGQPNFSDYAPGCLEPDSEDGELHYDGFVVYTVRTATREYVYDVD